MAIIIHRPGEQLAAAAVTGIVAHLCYFIHGEHDLMAANIVRAHLLAALCLAYVKRHYEGLMTQQAVTESVTLLAAYAVTLWTSIVIFRLFFSPLNSIRGPLRHRLTKLAHMWSMAHRRNCEILEDLRQEYGDVVRTGTFSTSGLVEYAQLYAGSDFCRP